MRKTATLGKALAGGAILFMATPAAGILFYREIFPSGTLPDGFYDDEPCFPETIDQQFDSVSGLHEVRVSPIGVRDDGDPNTFLRCQDHGEDEIRCMAGFSDGTVAHCRDLFGPHVLPELNDRLYILIDPERQTPQGPTTPTCEIFVETSYGEDNPNCYEPCNASTATQTVQPSVATTISGDACVRLEIPGSWGRVMTHIESQPETDNYPVSFDASSCLGQKSGSFSQDWQKVDLVEGDSNTTGCDVFLRFNHLNGPVTFKYYGGSGG